MRACIFTCLWALCAALALAQPKAPQPNQERPQPVGLETDWDIATTIQKLSTHAAGIETALAKIDARAWVEQGAPETYAEQVESTREQAKYLSASAKTWPQARSASPRVSISFSVWGQWRPCLRPSRKACANTKAPRMRRG